MVQVYQVTHLYGEDLVGTCVLPRKMASQENSRSLSFPPALTLPGSHTLLSAVSVHQICACPPCLCHPSCLHQSIPGVLRYKHDRAVTFLPQDSPILKGYSPVCTRSGPSSLSQLTHHHSPTPPHGPALPTSFWYLKSSTLHLPPTKAGPFIAATTVYVAFCRARS